MPTSIRCWKAATPDLVRGECVFGPLFTGLMTRDGRGRPCPARAPAGGVGGSTVRDCPHCTCHFRCRPPSARQARSGGGCSRWSCARMRWTWIRFSMRSIRRQGPPFPSDRPRSTALTWRHDMFSGRTPASQALADRLVAAGFAGMRVGSYAAGAGERDVNLVLWRWGDRLPTRVALIDKDDRLGLDR